MQRYNAKTVDSFTAEIRPIKRRRSACSMNRASSGFCSNSDPARWYTCTWPCTLNVDIHSLLMLHFHVAPNDVIWKQALYRINCIKNLLNFRGFRWEVTTEVLGATSVVVERILPLLQHTYVTLLLWISLLRNVDISLIDRQWLSYSRSQHCSEIPVDEEYRVRLWHQELATADTLLSYVMSRLRRRNVQLQGLGLTEYMYIQ